MPSDPETKAL
jgi:hypothetical protein